MVCNDGGVGVRTRVQNNYVILLFNKNRQPTSLTVVHPVRARLNRGIHLPNNFAMGMTHRVINYSLDLGWP